MIYFFIFVEFLNNLTKNLTNKKKNIVYNILLQPRHFIFKRKQKKRKTFIYKINHNFLKFGSSGLLLLQPAHLTSVHLFRFKLFLKKASRKADYTKRFVWFHAFPHLPLTKKPTGTRMGKGKGKLEC